MFTQFDSDHSVETAYQKIMKQSNYDTDYEILSSTRNEQIVLKGSRNYSVGLLVGLIIFGFVSILGFVIALVYYLTRPYRKIVIEFEQRDIGCQITITSSGKISSSKIYAIRGILETYLN